MVLTYSAKSPDDFNQIGVLKACLNSLREQEAESELFSQREVARARIRDVVKFSCDFQNAVTCPFAYAGRTVEGKGVSCLGLA